MSKPVKTPAGQRSLEDVQREAKSQYEADVRWVMTHPAGRRFVWQLVMGTCNLTGRSFTASGSETFFNEGRRAVGTHVYSEVLRVAPAQAAAMYQEASDAQQEATMHREAALGREDSSD